MFSDRGAFVGCFGMMAAHGASVAAHPHSIQFYKRGGHDCEYYFCRYGTVRTKGLSPHSWITARRLHVAKMLGVCACNIFYILIVKNLDSRVWHQSLRKYLTSHANFLANTLHLPRGKLATYFKLFTTFLISGLLHAIAEHLFFQNFHEGATVQYFLLQAVGITFEDAVIGIASRLGSRGSNTFKLIGYLWPRCSCGSPFTCQCGWIPTGSTLESCINRISVLFNSSSPFVKVAGFSKWPRNSCLLPYTSLFIVHTMFPISG